MQLYSINPNSIAHEICVTALRGSKNLIVEMVEEYKVLSKII